MDKSLQKSRRASLLYGGAIMVGFLAQLITSWLLVRSGGADATWRWLPALFTIVVMGGYAYLSYLHTPEHFETLDFADGFYYLGFLFTLIALCITLWLMGGYGLEESNRFILSQFGLALVTTVVGLAGKLLLTLEYEATPPSLDALIAEAKKSLRATRDAGRSYGLMMSQMTEETRATLTHGTEILRSTVDQMKHPLANALDGLAQELDGANNKVRDSHEKLTNAVNGIGTKLAASVSELTDALAVAQREASSVGPLFPELQDHLSGLSAGFESMSKQMMSSKDSFGRLMKESTDLLSTSSKTVATAADSLKTVTGTMLAEAEKGGEAIRDRINESTQAITAYAESLQDAAATVNEIAVRPWRDAAAAQQQNQNIFVESAERGSEAVNGLVSSLKELADAQQKALQDFDMVRSELVTAVRALNDQLDA